MLSNAFLDSLYSSEEVQRVYDRYESAKVPFMPAFQNAADIVTGGIDRPVVSSLIQQVVVLLLDFLDYEINKDRPKSAWAKFFTGVWNVLKRINFKL